MGNEVARRPILAITTVPDYEDLGPAMRACTEAEREFVVALFQNGATNYTEAALLTGRFTSRESAQAASSRWMAKPRVLLALDEFVQVSMKQGLAISTKALIEIASDTMHKDRLKASIELLNRNGHLVETVQRHIIEHEADTTTKSLLEEIRSLAADPDVRKALKTGFIEGEYTELTNGDGSEGLEDLLS